MKGLVKLFTLYYQPQATTSLVKCSVADSTRYENEFTYQIIENWSLLIR